MKPIAHLKIIVFLNNATIWTSEQPNIGINLNNLTVFQPIIAINHDNFEEDPMQSQLQVKYLQFLPFLHNRNYKEDKFV